VHLTASSPTSQSFGASGGTGAVSVSHRFRVFLDSLRKQQLDPRDKWGQRNRIGDRQLPAWMRNSGSARNGDNDDRRATRLPSRKPEGVVVGHSHIRWAGIAHAGGAGGSVWRSTLCVTNRSGFASGHHLGYRMGSSAVTRTAPTPERLDQGVGGCRGQPLRPDWQHVGAPSRSSQTSPSSWSRGPYNEAPDGTFGQGMPGNDDTATLAYRSAGKSCRSSKGPRRSGQTWAWMNHGVTACNVRIKLFSETGSQLGSTINTRVPAKQWEQINGRVR